MKGIVLAGGTATRLFPLTIVTNKHLLPIYDRPMIYYPIETLAGMGIREVMVIVGGKIVGDVVELLGDGSHFGLDLTYTYQPRALGIAPLAPSGRGALDITDVLNHYSPGRRLFTRVYDGHWTDAGTVPSLLRAAELTAEDYAAGRLAPPTQRPLQRRTDEVELPPRV